MTGWLPSQHLDWTLAFPLPALHASPPCPLSVSNPLPSTPSLRARPPPFRPPHNHPYPLSSCYHPLHNHNRIHCGTSPDRSPVHAQPDTRTRVCMSERAAQIRVQLCRRIWWPATHTLIPGVAVWRGRHRDVGLGILKWAGHEGRRAAGGMAGGGAAGRHGGSVGDGRQGGRAAEREQLNHRAALG